MDALVTRARAYLDENLDRRITLNDLAAEVGASPYHLQRVFTRTFGVSPRAYVEARRIERLRAAKGRTVLEAAYEAGFGSSRAVYEAAAKSGATPAERRRDGAGLAVRYTLGKTPLGRTIVATTPRGICAIAIGDDEEALLREVQRDLPKATLVRDDRGLRSLLEGVRAAIDGGELPALDLQGTPFQDRVWRALRAIPKGETRTYAALARALGTSPRAIARACASNRVAVLVPCHRVVAESGELAGYRWGIERKRALIARERSSR